MAGITSGKAISAVQNGDIVEDTGRVRAFTLRSGSSVHRVILGPGSERSCTCRAAQAGVECYAVHAARLLAKQNPPKTAMTLARRFVDGWGPDVGGRDQKTTVLIMADEFVKAGAFDDRPEEAKS